VQRIRPRVQRYDHGPGPERDGVTPGVSNVVMSDPSMRGRKASATRPRI